MPNSGKTRREPDSKGKGFSAQGGFTIIEILIVAAIIIVVVSTMLPMKRSSTGQRELLDSANSISEFLATARLEANIRKSETVLNYQYFNRSDWCLGFVTGQQSCDCTVLDPSSPEACTVDSELRTLQAGELSTPVLVSSMRGDGNFIFSPARSVAFDAAGRRIYDDAVLQLETPDRALALQVHVSSTGNISTCTERGKLMIPGYHECLNALR